MAFIAGRASNGSALFARKTDAMGHPYYWKAILVMLMKKTVILMLATLLFTSSAVLACDKTKTKDTKKNNTAAADRASKNKTPSSEQKGGTLLTGSYVKQNVKRHGQITDGANQVIVLDRETIERSGASDVKQLLNRQGVH